MAENDGSFDAAKNHGKSNNHEVIDHFRNMAPADNTRVASPSGPNVDSSTDRKSARMNKIDAGAVAHMADTYDINDYVSNRLKDSKANTEVADKKDAAKNKVLKDTNLK